MFNIKEHAWLTDELPGLLIAQLKMCKDDNYIVGGGHYCGHYIVGGQSLCASYCASSGSCLLKMWGRISCKGILPLYSSIPDHHLVLIWQGCECACDSSNEKANLLSSHILDTCIFSHQV